MLLLLKTNKPSPISPSTRQHLVDPNNVEWMQSHSDMELIFTAILHQVFVGADTARFQSFGTQLFVFIRNQMYAERKIIHSSFLLTQIENTDFWVGYTTTETRFWVGFVFAIAITAIVVEKGVITSTCNKTKLLLTISLVVYPFWP